jgi:hypothetical protein
MDLKVDGIGPSAEVALEIGDASPVAEVVSGNSESGRFAPGGSGVSGPGQRTAGRPIGNWAAAPSVGAQISIDILNEHSRDFKCNCH